MGKGDKKTKKGKITIGSYGVSRKKKKVIAFVAPKPKAKKATPVEAEDAATKQAPKAAPKKKAAAKKPAAKKTTAKKTAEKK